MAPHDLWALLAKRSFKSTGYRTGEVLERRDSVARAVSALNHTIIAVASELAGAADGEAPGEQEDRTGMPFVGSAGRELDKLLRSIGLTLDDVYIANILKYRPPGNRDPQADEIEACTPWLIEQLSLIQPRVIVTLGKFGPNVGIDRIESVIRLNNICNDLGLDTASTGSTIAWAMELYQRGIITNTCQGDGTGLSQIHIFILIGGEHSNYRRDSGFGTNATQGLCRIKLRAWIFIAQQRH